MTDDFARLNVDFMQTFNVYIWIWSLAYTHMQPVDRTSWHGRVHIVFGIFATAASRLYMSWLPIIGETNNEYN